MPQTATMPTATLSEVSSGWRRNPSVVLAVILTAQLMVVLDATIVNVALPHIQRSLHFSNSSLSWVLNAYAIVFAALLVPAGRAADLIGRRAAFLAGMVIFGVASAACAAAPPRTRPPPCVGSTTPAWRSSTTASSST